MTDDPIRAAFEAYMRADGWTNHGLLRDKEYADAQIRLAFEYYLAGYEAARTAALEEAAKVCEEAVCCEDKGPDGVCCGQLRHQTADECAARIRAMVKP